MMKSILSFALLIVSAGLMAQSIDDIKGFAGKNQWDKAKEGIDKYLANEKNAKKGEGWYLKAQVYNGIARDSVFADKYGDARVEAFSAYKKYLELDPKGLEGLMNSHAQLFDVAFGYLEIGSKKFNEKKFDEALAAFKNSEPVQEYIISKGFSYGTFSFPAFDTQLYLNIAASAINAKKEDVAVQYYQKIVENKIKDQNYEEIYRWVVDYYERKNDKTNLDKYLAIAKEVYPADEFWCEVVLKSAGDDKRKLFAKYDELLAGGCDTYYTRYNYGVELFNFTYVGDSVPADRAALQAKLEDVLKKAIPMNPPATEANMLMCRHHFATLKYLADDYDAVKGGKPEDLKKRSDINALMNKSYEAAHPYLTTLFNHFEGKTDLKGGEKGQYKIVASMLLEYWENKKDKAKIAEFSEKLKQIE